jgi:hypothetical protein
MLKSPETQSPTAIEVQLIRIAAVLAKRTKTACLAALRAAGLPGRSQYVDWMLERLRCHDQWHKERHLRHVQRRFAYLERMPEPTNQGRRARLPAGTPMERLTRIRRDALVSLARQTMRSGAAGGCSFTVSVCKDSESASYVVSVIQNRDTYKGKYKGYPASEDHHHITVPVDWRTRVERLGLSHLDGLLTLDAEHVSHVEGMELFQATWARQGRGYSVVTERGYIAREGALSFHAASAEAAIAGLQRKRRAGQRNGGMRCGAGAHNIDAFIKRHRHVTCELTIDDARDTGSCEPGIRRWCHATGIDFARQRIPMSEALDAFKKVPAPEARLAILHAVRRHKKYSRSHDNHE